VNAPTVSVILPVYNAERHLAQAIESILEQTYQDFEFLIINDGSTDRSQEILESYALADQRVRVFARPNLGLVRTLNEGLGRARGEYIARMDADDVSRPERFRMQVEFLDANPRCVVVGTSFTLIDDAGQELTTWHCFISDRAIRHALPAEGCIPHPTAMFRKTPVLNVGGYNEDYPVSEDYDLWRRLAGIGELHNLPEPLLYKREWAGAISIRDAAIQRQIADRIRHEVWADKGLREYRRLSLDALCQLPDEHQPALVNLQKELARIALRHNDVGLFVYLCSDLVRFSVIARSRRGHRSGMSASG
jgi:glycosyltransferase involved in cell wall biosynthesis